MSLSININNNMYACQLIIYCLKYYNNKLFNIIKILLKININHILQKILILKTTF